MDQEPLPPANEDAIAHREVSKHLSPVERVIERSTIHFDVAACIRWTLVGLAFVIMALSGSHHDLAATVAAVLKLP